jgi:hypothetical protein
MASLLWYVLGVSAKQAEIIRQVKAGVAASIGQVAADIFCTL